MNKFALTVVAGILLSTTLIPTALADKPEIPGKIVINHIERVYMPVEFDHARHATRFADGCGDCHHQHRGLEKNPCKRCHAIDAAQFRDSAIRSFKACDNCHGDYDPAQPDVPNLKVAYHKVCLGCHQPSGEAGKTEASCGQTCHAKK